MESEGPVVQGWRLENLEQSNAWPAIAYGKGTWICTCCAAAWATRAFNNMLAELRKRYEWKSVGTEDFRALCAEFLPPGFARPEAGELLRPMGLRNRNARAETGLRGGRQAGAYS